MLPLHIEAIPSQYGEAYKWSVKKRLKIEISKAARAGSRIILLRNEYRRVTVGQMWWNEISSMFYLLLYGIEAARRNTSVMASIAAQAGKAGSGGRLFKRYAE